MPQTSTPVIKSWNIVLLDESHDRASFDCGSPALNDFIRKQARQQGGKHLGRTFVATDGTSQSQAIYGYYTISASSIDFKTLPATLSKKLPNKIPIPAARIARLATDLRARGQRLGETLLIHALRRAAQLAASELGIAFVVVDAKDETAKSFYLKYGFVPLVDMPLTLVLPTATILKL